MGWLRVEGQTDIVFFNHKLKYYSPPVFLDFFLRNGGGIIVVVIIVVVVGAVQVIQR